MERIFSVVIASNDPILVSLLFAEIQRRGLQGPEHPADQLSQSISNITCSQNVFRTWYHFKNLTIETAKELYRLGMQATDVVSDHYYHNGTPLFNFARGCAEAARHIDQKDDNWKFQPLVDMAEWLVETGARLNYLDRGSKTTPVHLLTASIMLVYIMDLQGHLVKARYYSLLERHDQFVQRILTSVVKDSCTCACSQSGCEVPTVVGFVIKRETYEWAKEESCIPRQLDLIVGVVKVLLHFDPSVETRPAARQALLRALTFDQLGLTHTCHTYHPYGIEDCDCFEIQDLEKDDISLLDELMEEFSNAWIETDGSLVEFLRSHWAEKIREVVTERNKPHADELENILNLGVHLELLGPEEKPDNIANLLRKHGTWEWFQEVVHMIEEGECNEGQLRQIIGSWYWD